MSADLLPAISAFTRVAHHGSFTRAAAELGVSASALSQTVGNLERRLGVRLLDRTTRRVAVTEIGRRFLPQAEQGLATLLSAIDDLDETRDRPAGVLRLNVSRAAADILLVPHLSAFAEACPDVVLDLRCDNGKVDLVGGNFDAGIRLGELLAQDMVARPFGGPQRLATFAAPSYLAGRAMPKTPTDLNGHRCLNGRLSTDGAVYRWEYANDGQRFEVETPGALVCNDGDLLIAAARAGAGISCGFEAQVRDDFARGWLIPLLEPWWPAFSGFHVYYASRRQVPRKLSAFIDFMQLRLNTAAPSSRRGVRAVEPDRNRRGSRRVAPVGRTSLE